MAKIMAAEGTDPADQPQMTEQEKEQRLKYLAFVQSAALHALFLAVKLYNYAKDKSGLLKPGIQTVEGTVQTVVGPIYNKFHDVPVDFLKFVDRKVDESVNKVPFPPMLMQVAGDVKTVGVIETASGFVRMVYIKYEPVAEKYAVCAWRSLNKLPLFPLVAQTVVVPTAAFCSEKYNQTVQITAEKGYKVATYLPLVPTDKIAEVFSSDCNNKHITDIQDKAPDAPAEVEGPPAEDYTSDAY